MLTRYVRGATVWVDCVSPTPAEVRGLMQEFSIDPTIAEEMLLPSYKPKVEQRGSSIYLILHFPSLRGGHKRGEQEIDFVLGKHFLITTRYETVGPLHAFAKAFEVSAVLGTGDGKHGGDLLVSMLSKLYQALIDECDGLGRRLTDIEEHIFQGDERKMVAELSQVGRVIHDFRQSLAPHQEMLKSLEPPALRMFGPDFSYALRNAAAMYERVHHTLENLRDSLQELRETNNSLLSTKQNEIMKTLTVLAFVFLPLSFIASLFGMNARSIPIIGLPGDFWIIVGGMAVIAGSCFVYFKRKEWL